MHTFIVLGLLWAMPAVGQTAQPTALMYGIGMDSCATWRSTAWNIQQGTIWIEGFWTATNEADESDHSVGRSTDLNGIVGEMSLMTRHLPIPIEA